MSSWFPSIFNDNPLPQPSSPTTPSDGVKEDLSTLFRGVAAFLAPPPAIDSDMISGVKNDLEEIPLAPLPPNSDMISGIKNDLAEIQGTLKSGLSLLSSKLTSNLLQFPRETKGSNDDDDLDEDGAVGVTEEVVDFVRKISSRPALWTDFPISLPDDVDMSDCQREHAAEIEHLVPNLRNLRQKISSQISHGKFWMIYFILLFPRLNEEDLKLLSTPEGVKMSERLFQKLQNKSNTNEEPIDNSKMVDSSKEDGIRKGEESTTQQNMSNESLNAIEETKVVSDMDSDHRSPKKSDNEDGFSFSELEDDENDLSGFKKSQFKKVLSTSDGKEWVELNENSGAQDDQRKVSIRDKGSESEESNDWFTVDKFDIDNSTVV